MSDARAIADLNARLAALETRAAELEDAPVEIGNAGGDDADSSYPFQVYISGGYVCVRQGHHIWWNSYTSVTAVTTLSKAVGDAWVAPGSATVIYVKRVFNSDGTATVTLEYANTDYASVIAAVDGVPTESRWILATLSSGVIQTQWWRAGDISEWRVS